MPFRLTFDSISAQWNHQYPGPDHHRRDREIEVSSVVVILSEAKDPMSVESFTVFPRNFDPGIPSWTFVSLVVNGFLCEPPCRLW